MNLSKNIRVIDLINQIENNRQVLTLYFIDTLIEENKVIINLEQHEQIIIMRFDLSEINILDRNKKSYVINILEIDVDDNNYYRSIIEVYEDANNAIASYIKHINDFILGTIELVDAMNY